MKTIVEKVLLYGQTMPQKNAVCFKKTRVTYGELAGSMRKVAAELHLRGIAKGDRVMVSAVSKPEYIAALLGIQYIGAISVAVDKMAKPQSILDIWEDSGAKLFLVDGKKLPDEIQAISLKRLYENAWTLSEEADDLFEKPEEEQLCELLYTTGSTGKPKGVMLSYRCIYANTLNTWHGIDMQESDVVLNPLPLNHSFGMRVLRSTLFIGATTVLQNGFTFAKEIENNILEHCCTAMVCAPASIEIIYQQMQDNFSRILGSLRYMEFSAGSVSVETKKRLLKLLPNTRLFNTWGSTETGGAVFLDMTAYPDKLASIGRPIEGVEMQVMDADGRPCRAIDVDTAGRMSLRGNMQMEGYWSREDLTKETIKDGWLWTNDLVYCDQDGFVYMIGRADDIIKVGGENVSPVEVENIVQEYEQVRECACIGASDPQGILGQVLILFVVTESGLIDRDMLMVYLTERMERYKLPHEVIQLDALPRNQMQKLDRVALRRMYAERDTEDLMNPVICNLLTRRSVRMFTEQPIDRKLLDIILKTGYYAPTGHNMQTWRFTVLTSEEKIQELKEVVKDQAQKTGTYFYGFENPKVLVLVSNDRRNSYGVQDVSCAVENMMLAAWSYGIGSVWLNPMMTLCDEPEIRSLLDNYGLPKRHIVWAAVAFGYPKVQGKLLAKKEDVVNFVE